MQQKLYHLEKYRDAKGMPLDGAPFHPYKTFGALPAIGVFFIVFFVAENFSSVDFNYPSGHFR